jgi:predicted YcjX-like family ATPase
MDESGMVVQDMKVQWEKGKTTLLQQQMRLAVYGLSMGDSDIFTFAILPALLIPPAHYPPLSIAARRASVTDIASLPKNLTPRPSNHANARQPGSARTLLRSAHVTSMPEFAA